MQLYADEDFAYPAVNALRQLGHDIVTAQEDGAAGLEDLEILDRAHALGRSVLSFNRRHFERLHRQGYEHCGIITCTRDANFAGLAIRIDSRLTGLTTGRWCLRINRGA